MLRPKLRKPSLQQCLKPSKEAVPLISEFLNGWFAPFYVKNCLFVRIQSTSNTDGMTSLESLSKDVIPSLQEANCVRTNIQFLYKTLP